MYILVEDNVAGSLDLSKLKLTLLGDVSAGGKVKKLVPGQWSLVHQPG